MNIVDALLKHHEEIRELFKEVQNKPEMLSDLKNHLVVHHENEEKFLLNKLRDRNELKDDSLESVEEHHVLDMLLNDLDDFPKDNERWKVKFGILKEFTEHHLTEEEEDIFGLVKEKMDSDEMEALGNEFQKNKENQLNALVMN